MDNLGIYIHIPFCKSRCNYCSFLSSIYNPEIEDKYFNSLKKEIILFSNSINKSDYVVDTIYIGGGTPSICKADNIKQIVDLIKEKFRLSLKEFTIECNPNSITKEKLEIYKAMGINRISIGVQSLKDKSLKAIGRAHDRLTAIEKVDLVNSFGFEISCDLMVGLPFQEKEDIKDYIDTFSKKVEHISTYMLSLEDGTCLKEMVDKKEIEIPDDDKTVDLMEYATNYLEEKGYIRYEISNFARKNHEAKHNMGYWEGKDYIGFGPSAHSLIKNTRFYNINDIDKYMENIEKTSDSSFYILEGKLTEKDIKNERIMLSLRTKKGLDLLDFKRQFSMDFLVIYKDKILQNKDYLIIEDGYIKIKPQYFNVMNSIIVDFLDM